VLPRHRGGNCFFCDFYGFLDYLIRLSHMRQVGGHSLKSRAEDLQSLLFIQFHSLDNASLGQKVPLLGTR